MMKSWSLLPLFCISSINLITGQEFCSSLSSSSSDSRNAIWDPTSCSSDNQRKGNRCHMKCKPGYTLKAGALMSIDCVLKDGVTWTNLGTEECERTLFCPALVGDLYAKCKKSQIVPDDTCHLSKCPSQQTVVGPTFLKCFDNGTWSAGGSYCKEPNPVISMTCSNTQNIVIETDPNSDAVDARKYIPLPTLSGISSMQLKLPSVSSLKPSGASKQYKFQFDEDPSGQPKTCSVSVKVEDKQAPAPTDCVEEEERIVRKGSTAPIQASQCKFNDNVDGEIAGTYGTTYLDKLNFRPGVHTNLWYEATDTSGNSKRSTVTYTVHEKECNHVVMPIGVKMEQLLSGTQYTIKCADPAHKNYYEGAYPFKFLFDQSLTSPFRSCLSNFVYNKPVLDCYAPVQTVNKGCQTGYVADDDEKFCIPCPRGFRYIPDKGFGSDCKLCPENESTDQMGSSTCTPCPKNSRTVGDFRMCQYYCKPGEVYDGANCKACPSGTYGLLGADKCSDCPANKITIKEKASLIDDCVPGVKLTQSYGTTDMSVAQNEMTYIHLNMTTSQNQLHQSVGLSFQSSELNAVTNCEDGYVQVVGYLGEFQTNLTGMLCGDALSAGKQHVVQLRPWRNSFVQIYSKTKSVNVKITYGYGACEQGKYFNLTTGQCTDCAQGTFQAAKNSYTCQPCANGMTNYGVGQAACIKPCPRGFEGTGLSCTPCAINTYEKDFKCVQCIAGEATASQRSTQCLSACGSGQYRNSSSGTCVKCPYGQYQSLTKHALNACMYCSPGRTTLKDGATNPNDCLVKEKCNYEGQFYNTNTDKCEDCPVGTYKIASDVTVSSCTNCPNGMDTLMKGSSRLSDCKPSQTACQANNPCKSPGQCVEVNDKATCICPKYYTGQNCEQVDGPCKTAQCNNGKCVPFFKVSSKNYTCVCNPGFTGEACDTAHNPCDPNPCNRGNCTNDNSGGFKCICPMYRTGKLCDTQMQTPCDKASNCHPQHGVCKLDSVDAGKFTCTCKNGYEGSACDKAFDYCQKNPCNSEGTESCTNDLAGATRKCVCKSGYQGDDCGNSDVCGVGQFYWQKKCCTCIQGFYRGQGSTSADCAKCPVNRSTLKRGATRVEDCIDLEKKEYFTVSLIVTTTDYQGKLDKKGCGALDEGFENTLTNEIAKNTGTDKSKVSVQINSYNPPPDNKLGMMVNITIYGNNEANKQELKSIVGTGNVGLYSLDDKFMKISRTNEGEDDNNGGCCEGGNNTVVIAVVISIIAVVIIVILLVWLLKCGCPCNKKNESTGIPMLGHNRPTDIYT